MSKDRCSKNIILCNKIMIFEYVYIYKEGFFLNFGWVGRLLVWFCGFFGGFWWILVDFGGF